MKRALALLICALAGACATPEPATPAVESTAASMAVAPPAGQSYAEDLLAYLARLRAMNESALNAEAARMKRDASDIARVKAALALSLAPQSDDTEIIELAEPVARKPSADRDVRAMAAFLHTTAIERRRLRQRAANAAGELREERKVAESQKQRAETLQQKLDALTEVERSLAAREKEAR